MFALSKSFIIMIKCLARTIECSDWTDLKMRLIEKATLERFENKTY